MDTKKNSNTTLLLIIILILAAGLVYYIYKDLGKSKKELAPISNTSKEDLDSLKEVDGEWITATANGISIDMPKEYTFNTDVARAAGNNAVALNVAYNNKLIISIYKWSNKALFEESIPKETNFKVVKINGEDANYYEVKNVDANASDLGGYIIIPSKSVVIQIEPASFAGVTQSNIEQMIASIKF